MSNIILPDDPEWNEPIVMGDAFKKGLTPKTAAIKRNRELDEMRDKENPDANFRYANSAIAHAPDAFMKFAQMTGVSNMMTNPMWFSPLHTPQNWQIASKRREIYQWLTLSPITTYDFTYQEMSELNFIHDGVIEDTITGGLLYDDIDSEPILSGSGKFRRPAKFSVRKCDDKLMYEFRAYGFWRTVIVSEEHPMIVLGGKLYRHKKKIESNARYRRGKGIEPNGVEKVKIPDKLISRKQAQEVSDQDYLLAPVPQIGHELIDGDTAWLLGIVIADGTISDNDVRITLDKREKHRSEIINVFSKFPGKTSERQHHSKFGWRISKYTRDCRIFCSKYITGKLTEKKFRKDIFKLDKESRFHVLGGYFDGDGSFSKAEGKLIANNYSCDMADQLYWLLLSVGIRASLGRYPLYGDHYETNSKWVYRLFIPQSDILKLKPYMRSNKIPDDFTPRNVRELRFFYEEDGVTYLAQPIESIKQFRYTGLGYDIQIDPERSFVASGYVTSNCRFFYENEPKVAAAIDFYSRFPMNGFDLVCKDTKILNWFNHHVVKRLNLNDQLKMISSEYFMLGDVFVHLDVDCPVCQGSAVDPDTGEQCNHPGGSFKRMLILNPDWIEVQQSILADEPSIVMIPDEELKRIIFYKQPKAIYDRIPDSVKKLVLQNKPIPLSNRTLSHMKHMPVPYGTYGTSLIRRLFTTLAYKTKIMTANWIVAERLILPVRVVKVGSDARPASSADIADIQTQLANTANDPNLTIVTHHNFEYDWYGATGKILQITQEMEHIDKEILDGFMLNQSLLNGEMCIPEHDKMLTKDGFKSLSQISKDDEVATFNKESGILEYQKPTAIHEYDYDGELTHFQTDRIDFACTPNHKMLYQKRDRDEWIVDTADTVRDRAKFVKTMKWRDATALDYARADVELCGKKVPFDQLLKIVAYYVTEGHCSKETRKERTTFGEINSLYIAQTEKGKGWKDLCGLKSECESMKTTRHGFAIYNKKFAKIMSANCGRTSHEKRIPGWIKCQSTVILKKFLGYLINGDGSLRTRDKDGPKKYYTYYTNSLKLRDDVMEIALKCGYFPRFRHRRAIWEITFSDYDLGEETIPLNSKKYDTVTKIPYKGKVWCVTVPNGFIVTERNGKLMVSGNSGYQSAQVGVETLIRRIESWRGTMAEWIEENIFKPIAEMQGYIDEKASAELGETVFMYPTIKWNDLNLKDKNQWYQLLNSLHDKQVISTQTLLEEMDLDYDQEVQRMRYEMTAAGPAGGGLGAQPPGGGMGGMPGGDMGGGMGGMPGGDMGGGMGGMPGGDMGGGMAGGVGGGGMGGMASSGKVLKKGKGTGPQADQAEMAAAMPMIKLTSIEQEMAGMLERVGTALGWTQPQTFQKIRLQFPVQNPKGNKPYMLDFALPEYGLAVETDGEYFHNRPEQIQSDQERDHLLAQRGWTVLRFDDRVIGEAPQKVEATVLSYIKKAMDNQKQKQPKTASKKIESAHLFTMHKDKMVDLYGKYENYVKQRYTIAHNGIPNWTDVDYKADYKNPPEMYE